MVLGRTIGTTLGTTLTTLGTTLLLVTHRLIFALV